MARNCMGLMGLAHTYIPMKRWRWFLRTERYWQCVKCPRQHTWDEGMWPTDG